MLFLYFQAIISPLVLASFFLKKTDQRLIAIFLVGFYLLVFAMAFRFGVDWYEYEKSFENPGENYFEYGYVALEKFFSFLGFNYYVFQFFVKCCFWISCLKLMSKYSTLNPFSIFLYFLLSTVFLNDFIRQQLAAIFIFIALIRLKKGCFQFFFLVFLGSLFHKSAFFVLPFYFLYQSKKVENIFILLALIAFCFSFLNFSIVGFFINSATALLGDDLGERIVFYHQLTGSEMTLGRFLRFLLLILFVWNIKLNKKILLDENQRVVFIAVMMMLGYEMIFYDVMPIWARVREYFVVLFPALFFICFNNRLQKNAARLFVLVYAGYTFLGISIANSALFETYSSYNNFIYCEVFGCESYSDKKERDVESYWLSYWMENR